MTVGLYKSEYTEITINWNDRFREILHKNNINVIELDASKESFLEELKKINYFIFRWIHYDNHHQIATTLFPFIQNSMKIKCFPDITTSWHFDDKIKQYYLLKSQNYPVTDSMIFWDKNMALEWIKDANYPVVFKLKGGAGSSNVVLIKSQNDAKNLILKMFGPGIKSARIPHKTNVVYKDIKRFLKIKFNHHILNKIRQTEHEHWQLAKNYVLFQKYLPGNNFDTRVTTIGNRAFAFKRYVRENDFRASGSGLIDYNYESIDLKCVELALKISKEQGFQTMAYDFLYNENGEPEICEISYTYVDTAIKECPGYWDENLQWNQGSYWPQYLILKDLIKEKEIKP